MIRLIAHASILFLVGLVQLSLLPTWPTPVMWVHLLLCAIIFMTVLVSYQAGLWWAFVSGILLELYSFLPFGVLLVSLLATTVGVNFLFNHLFTNRSLYSLLLLGMFGTLAFNGFRWGLIWLLSVFGILSPSGLVRFVSQWQFLGWQIFLNSLVLLIVFIIFRFFTRKLRTDLHLNQQF